MDHHKHAYLIMAQEKPKIFKILFNENITNTSLEDIAIIHYCTPVKPWNCWNFCYPFHSVWTHYQNLSLWKNWKQKQPFQVRFRCKLLSLAYILGIKKIEL